MVDVTSVYLVIALVGAVSCQDLPIIYNAKVNTGGNSSTVCPATHDVRENVTKDIRQLVKSSIIPSLTHTKGDMEPVTVVVLDGEELPISMCLTQHRLAHQLGSSLLLQEGPVLDLLMLASCYVIQLCSLLKVFNTLRSAEESLDISLDSQKHL